MLRELFKKIVIGFAFLSLFAAFGPAPIQSFVAEMPASGFVISGAGLENRIDKGLIKKITDWRAARFERDAKTENRKEILDNHIRECLREYMIQRSFSTSV